MKSKRKYIRIYLQNSLFFQIPLKNVKAPISKARYFNVSSSEQLHFYGGYLQATLYVCCNSFRTYAAVTKCLPTLLTAYTKSSIMLVIDTTDCSFPFGSAASVAH